MVLIEKSLGLAIVRLAAASCFAVLGHSQLQHANACVACKQCWVGGELYACCQTSNDPYLSGSYCEVSWDGHECATQYGGCS